MTSMNGTCGSWPGDIVQDWSIPGEHVGLDLWRKLPDDFRNRIIEKEAEDNGIEKPKGHTVSFHYNARVEGHHFGSKHPMKPWRLTLTKQLVLSYGLQYAMDLYESRMSSKEELAAFHSADYLEFLKRFNPRIELDKETQNKYIGEDSVVTDCPAFEGMWDYFGYYTGASLDGARVLIAGQSDIAINWSGGLHHAHKNRAAGFCYVNDIVLAIQQLLLVHARVLYIDIDVHHGDGVEEAFFSTDRVMTLSFHNFDTNFFPGTGATTDVGPTDPDNPGAHHSLNVPYSPGIIDSQWRRVFEAVAGKAIDEYDPSAIVLQCGADSLGGDRLGQFNVNIKAHGFCVEFVKKKCHNRKLLILGGGGYTPRNVARCWTHETALTVDAKLRPTIPEHVPYRQAFIGAENGDGELYPNFDALQRSIHPNKNTEADLDTIIKNVFDQIRFLRGAPSIAMQHIPNDYLKVRTEEDEKLKDYYKDADKNEAERRRLEKNVGGRGELRGDN